MPLRGNSPSRTLQIEFQESNGRTSALSPHPLCEQLKYLVKSNEKANEMYVAQLRDWANSEYAHPMLWPILLYIEGGTILTDLQQSGVLALNAKGAYDEKLLVRWRVLGLDETEPSACWLGQFPLLILEGIVTFSYKGASPALMGACGERGIQLAFMTPYGKFLARTCGADRGNVLLRKQQYRVSDDPAASCRVARNMIFGKVHNSRWCLNRTLRDHPMRVDAAALRTAEEQLAAALPHFLDCQTLEELRGLEGAAANVYFGVLDELILNQKECVVDAAQSRELEAKLQELIDPERDSLRLYYMGNNYETKVRHFGVRPSYAAEGTLMI